MSSPAHLTTGELLQIDVAAELRTLSEAQLQGPWQAPAELVRLAIAGGATQIELVIRRRSFAVIAGGMALDHGVLAQLCFALDPSCSLAARHEAIIGLERAGAEALLWVAGSGEHRVRLRSWSDGRVSTCLVRPGQAPQLDRTPASTGSTRTEIEVSGGSFSSRRAIESTERACRFAPVPVLLNRRLLTPSFSGGLFRQELRKPLPGLLGITASGEAPRLLLLRHGVVAARATVPGYPAFSAAVEMAGLTPATTSAAATREAVAPYLTAIIDQAVLMLLGLAGQLPELSEQQRRRLTSLLLQTARLGLRRNEILNTPFLEVLGWRRRWLSPRQLNGLTTGTRTRTLLALSPGRREQPAQTSGPPVLLASLEQRALLGELLSLHFTSLPPQRRFLAWGIRGLTSRLVTAARQSWVALTTLSRARPITEDLLTPDERALGAAIEQCLAQTAQPLTVVFCEGTAAPRRHGERLLLPRHNPAVQGSVRIARHDPAWLYPVLLLLLRDSGSPPADLRTLWLRSTREPEIVG